MNKSPLAPMSPQWGESGAGEKGSAVREASRSSQRAAERLCPHVLVVDDESLIADSVATILNRNGYKASACYCGHEALRHFAEELPDIVVTDVVLPDLDGVQLARAVRALSPHTRVVLFSGNMATARLLEGNAGDGQQPFELLTKPVHPVQLLKTLKTA